MDMLRLPLVTGEQQGATSHPAAAASPVPQQAAEGHGLPVPSLGAEDLVPHKRQATGCGRARGWQVKLADRLQQPAWRWECSSLQAGGGGPPRCREPVSHACLARAAKQCRGSEGKDIPDRCSKALGTLLEGSAMLAVAVLVPKGILTVGSEQLNRALRAAMAWWTGRRSDALELELKHGEQFMEEVWTFWCQCCRRWPCGAEAGRPPPPSSRSAGAES